MSTIKIIFDAQDHSVNEYEITVSMDWISHVTYFNNIDVKREIKIRHVTSKNALEQYLKWLKYYSKHNLDVTLSNKIIPIYFPISDGERYYDIIQSLINHVDYNCTNVVYDPLNEYFDLHIDDHQHKYFIPKTCANILVNFITFTEYLDILLKRFMCDTNWDMDTISLAQYLGDTQFLKYNNIPMITLSVAEKPKFSLKRALNRKKSVILKSI